MDPVSIISLTAAVTGLLDVTAKILGALSGFTSSMVDAPKSAKTTQTVVEEMRLTLKSVEQLIDALSSIASERREMIQLSYLTITFTQSVLTLSELESLICSAGKDGLMLRLRWSWAEKKILCLLPRLEAQKSSLSLMVAVLRW
jgi:hypothetical protein